MSARLEHLRSPLDELRRLVAGLKAGTRGQMRRAVERWLGDSAAAAFHLRAASPQAPVVVIVGGTGTGKSTLVNRLTGAEVSATSFRRTFTGGAVAVAVTPRQVPEEWLGLEHRTASPDELPVRGQRGCLVIVEHRGELTSASTLVDTPDLDGDQPEHHAEADRAFRWACVALFVVTPEKYQMTELLPYYRLARRYGVPALFVMNKCEEQAVLDDYRELLARNDWTEASVFGVPRDDAGFEPAPEASLGRLVRTLSQEGEWRRIPAEGTARRCVDLLGRLEDKVLSPLAAARREVDRLLSALRAMRTGTDGVDVSPVTRELQRRMQEQSVLYLMGPERMLERITSIPSMLARLPRTAWHMMRGQSGAESAASAQARGQAPDFKQILVDQLAIVQSRMDDALRSSAVTSSWLEEDASGYAQTRVATEEAVRIAEEELAELKAWLEQRWQASPRDTRILQKLLSHLPGGTKAARWSEVAPYLLAIVVAAHGAVFGPIDLLIIGGFSVATWLGEKLSNEVTARTRATNRRMADRFDALAREQVDRVCRWLEERAPRTSQLDQVRAASERLSGALGQQGHAHAG